MLASGASEPRSSCAAVRPGTPEDAAELIVFLASDRARWLTGARYRVDGGILDEV
jgi:NAD(P)-dependent dehydrogenase (short-subunit alcohol dehydrogenase family)